MLRTAPSVILSRWMLCATQLPGMTIPQIHETCYPKGRNHSPSGLIGS
jgi:hypothetical protein